MRAAYFTRYGPPEVISIKEVPKPVPKKREILVKVDTALLSMGDCEMRSPKIPYFVWFMARLFFGLFRPRFKTLGSYFSGEIVEVGEEVTRFKPGDQVFGISMFGAHAEYMKAPEKNAIIIRPPELSHEEVAPLGLGLDSLHFLQKAKVKEGDEVLINGAGGGIGTYALYLAKHFGATVTAVDRGYKLDMLTENGADHVIDYTQGDFSKDGKTYDVIFDVVGKLSHSRSMRLLKKKGYYISAVPQMNRIFINLFSNLFSSKTYATGMTNAAPEDLQHLLEKLQNGEVKTVIDKIYPLEEIVEAEKFIEAEERKGNVVLKIGD